MSRKLGLTAAGAVLALSLAACGGGGAGSSSSASGDEPEARATSPSASRCRPRPRSAGSPTATPSSRSSEAKGYKVDLQYAGDDIPTQSQQVDQMITQGADAADHRRDRRHRAQQPAAGRGRRRSIPVIAYDRLIRDTQNVDFYVSFDNYKVGVAQATALLTGLGVLNKDGSKGDGQGSVQHRAVRRLAGRQQRALLLRRRDGHPEAVHRRRHAGRQVRPDQDRAGRHLRWQQETAQKRMEDLLTSSYNDGTKVDGVLSPYDGLSRGIITALQNAGYGTTARQADADRHRSGRRDRLGQADQRRRAELHDLQGHPPAGRAGRHRRRGVPRRATSRRPTTPRRTTTASRSSRPTCCPS